MLRYHIASAEDSRAWRRVGGAMEVDGISENVAPVAAKVGDRAEAACSNTGRRLLHAYLRAA